MNLRLITFILTFLGPILGLNASIYKHVILEHPEFSKDVYIYFDVHIPLAHLNDRQAEYANKVIKTTKGKILTECTSFNMNHLNKEFKAKKCSSKYCFPKAVIDHAQKSIDSFIGVPGNLGDHFLTKLSNIGKKNYYKNFIFADDNRLSLNNGIHFLWLIGWLSPLADIVGIDIQEIENSIVERSGGDKVKVETFLNNIQKYFDTYLNELTSLQRDDMSNKPLADKIVELKGFIKQFKTISSQVINFSGKDTTLGDFRKKSKQHAHDLVKKFGPTKDVVKHLLFDVLSKEFDKFFYPAVQAYIFKPYNALDSTLLATILNDQSSDPIVVYVGAAHGRVIQNELERRGFETIDESKVRITKAGKISYYDEFNEYLASWKKQVTFNVEDVARIAKEFLGPLEQAFLAPLKK